MTREELVENLGTIAYSGSSRFIQELNKAGSEAQLDTLIGQFGVGFYSCFIVSEYVEVVSKKLDSEATKWTSDGSVRFGV
jgi:HSP90 family molecular chaperone